MATPKRSRNRKGTMKKSSRKQPITKHMVVGLIESSVHLDKLAGEKRRSEEVEFGRATGQTMEFGGESYKVVDLSGGVSIGILLSAQMLAGHAAELALKYAYESENPNQYAPNIHDLDSLYGKLSPERKDGIEADFAKRREGHESEPGDGWKTAEEVFRSGKDYPMLFRYGTEEAPPNFHFQGLCAPSG